MKGKHWIIAIIIVVAGYQVFTGLSDLTDKESIEWTEEDRTMLIEKCIKETGNNGILYPEIAREYCECGHDLLLAKFSKSEYLELIKRPTDEQVKLSKPIFQNCLTTYENKLKTQESDEWTDEEYHLMVEKCIQNSGENAVNHPAITRKYCECSRTKLIENISKAEMAALIKKPVEEQNEEATPLVAGCLSEFEKALELANK
ncbi:MAG: hypothetical protein RLO12_18500 [Fulvivirga sp.]